MSCGKKAFIDRKRAKKKVRKYKSEFWKKFKIYKCPDCGFYHLTTHIHDQEIYRTRKIKKKT